MPGRPDISAAVDRSMHAYRRGVQEFAGHVVMRVDRLMEGDLSLRDQEILYELRTALVAELGRRYPQFDLEAEAQEHA